MEHTPINRTFVSYNFKYLFHGCEMTPHLTYFILIEYFPDSYYVSNINYPIFIIFITSLSFEMIYQPANLRISKWFQVIVLTIISLIMFFVLSKKKNGHDSQQMALYEVSIVELLLYIITTIAVIIAMMKLRCLKYDRKIGEYLRSILSLPSLISTDFIWSTIYQRENRESI